MPRIIVPLDESEIAEQALPWAAAIASAFSWPVHLMSVWSLDSEIWMRAGVDPGSSTEKIAAALDEYLRRVAGGPGLSGITVTTEVRLGDVVDQLAQAATEGDTGMFVITSHGRGGIKRMVQGSVADELVRSARIPTLVVRAGQPHREIRKIVVTLDGSDTAERALEPARELAAATGASIALLRVVNPVAEVAWTGVGPAPDFGELTQMLSDAALSYLKEKAREGETIEVRYGRPLDVVLDYVQEWDADLVAMGTHGRGGIARLALGSTTDAVVRSADRPVYIIPLPSDE